MAVKNGKALFFALKCLADFQISSGIRVVTTVFFQKNSSRYWRRQYFFEKALLAIGEDRIFPEKLFSLLAKTIFFQKNPFRY
jgi:hypothetical protein